MKYEAVHTLQSNQPIDGDVNNVKFVTIKPGQILTEKELTDAGFDLDHLKANGAVEELKGTESDEDRAARKANSPPPTTTQDATPHMATAPKGEPETPGATPAHGRKAAAADDDSKGHAKK
jgi:hypothetical protein